PVRAFTDADAAERFRLHHELQARQGCNPFDYGENLRDLSEYGDELKASLCAVLEEMGSHDAWNWDDIGDWQAWWPPEAQEAAIWELLDGVRFYETHVTELEGAKAGKPEAGPLFVVHAVNWVEYAEDGRTRTWSCLRNVSPEGLFAGRPFQAFVERSAAEA